MINPEEYDNDWYAFRAMKSGESFKSYHISPVEFSNNLSKVNLLVGQNNSGKSRFIRQLFSFKFLDNNYSDIDINKFNQYTSEAKDELKRIFRKHGVIEIGKIGVETNKLDDTLVKLKDTTVSENGLEEIRNIVRFIQKIVQIEGNGSLNIKYTGHFVLNQFLRSIEQFKGKYWTIFEKYILSYMARSHYIYIPILRGLRPINTTDEDLYKARTQADYFTNYFDDNTSTSSINYKFRSIFTGQSLYTDIQDMLLGTPEERQRIVEYEKFLTDEIFNTKVNLVPRNKKGSKRNLENTLFINIGGEERPVFELGDGIQSIIILTYPIFHYSDAVFFIEEPEHMIHPGYQRKILDLFLSGPGNHQFFLTTHSNHLLDLTMDFEGISIYSFIKDGEKFHMSCLSPGDCSILRELGVKESSVFLSNCTIWVEGITDRLYLRHFLKLYFQEHEDKMEYFENIHYAFVEFGGSNIAHWSFLDEDHEEMACAYRLCSNAMVIVDNDQGSKIERKNRLEEELGDRFLILEGNEIENLLSLDVIKSVIKDYENNIEESDFTEFSQSDYISKKLGEYIESKVFISGYKMKRKGGYQTKSGTIKSKVAFCEKALQYMGSYESLSEESKKLTMSIVKHIQSSNSS